MVVNAILTDLMEVSNAHVWLDTLDYNAEYVCYCKSANFFFTMLAQKKQILPLP